MKSLSGKSTLVDDFDMNRCGFGQLKFPDQAHCCGLVSNFCTFSINLCDSPGLLGVGGSAPIAANIGIAAVAAPISPTVFFSSAATLLRRLRWRSA